MTAESLNKSIFQTRFPFYKLVLLVNNLYAMSQLDLEVDVFKFNTLKSEDPICLLQTQNIIIATVIKYLFDPH